MDFLIAMVGAVFMAVVWTAVVVFAEPVVLQNMVAPAIGVDIQGWLDEFVRSQFYAVGLGTILALAWHATAARSAGRYNDRRMWWVALWGLCLLSSVLLCAVMIPDTQEGIVWAYALAFANGAFPFWFGTVWCTPGACKYAPIGAGRMRGVFGL